MCLEEWAEWPETPCLQPTLAIIYREQETQNVIQVVITVHDQWHQLCAQLTTCWSHFVTPARKNLIVQNVLLQQKSSVCFGRCISIQQDEMKINMIEKVRGTDFKTLLSPALRDTYQKKHFQVSLYLFWVEGEGVPTSWQGMSGEKGED